MSLFEKERLAKGVRPRRYFGQSMTKCFLQNRNKNNSSKGMFIESSKENTEIKKYPHEHKTMDSTIASFADKTAHESTEDIQFEEE